MWRMWERDWEMEEVDSGPLSLCPVKVEEHQEYLGGEVEVRGEKAL